MDLVRESLDAKFYEEIGETYSGNLFRGFVNVNQNQLENHSIVKDIAKNGNLRTWQLVSRMRFTLCKELHRRVFINPDARNAKSLTEQEAALFALYRTGILQAEPDDTGKRDILIFPTPLHERYIKYRPSFCFIANEPL